MIKLFTITCSFLFFTLNVIAAPADSSVSITSSKNSYQFIYNQKLDRVEVKQALNSVYTSNAYMVTFPITETYNNQVTIDEVSCKVDNHNVRDFEPKYAYYSVNDVFYSDEKICYFPVSLGKKGSTANVTFNETANDPRYFTTVYFSEAVEVKQKEISFKIPRWMNVELKEMNFGNYQISKTTTYDSKTDADIITYTALNLPAMKEEDNGPGPTYVYPHLMVLCKSAATGSRNFKYFSTLADQYAWYRTLVKDVNNDKTAISAKAKELTAGLTTDIDKIKAIFYYVQDNVRYIAFEDGMAGFKPESADEVLRKKYGDCKGMANLTKELLTSLGFDARLCWLGTDHIAYDYQTPSMAVDNHMICGLIYKGKTMYLDATETYLGLNEYAERIQGRQILMEDGDKYILNRVPVANQSQNYDYEKDKFTINGNNLTGSISHLWKGEDKEEVLSGLNSVKKEKTEDAMIGFLSNHNTDYTITNLKYSNADNPDKDLTAEYNMEFKNAVSMFSKSYYVDLDLKKEFLNGAIKISERKTDYWFEHKMNICTEAELSIPVNYKVSGLLPALNIVNADYEFHIQYSELAGKLIYKKTILIKNTHLSVAKFVQWNTDIEQLAKSYNDNVTLKPISE
jgi:hypothetical protein